MSKAQRKGDLNTAGGAILKGAETFIVNNKPSAVIAKPVSTHPPYYYPHLAALTFTAKSTFIIENQLSIKTGDKDTCGHARTGGSKDFYIDGE